MGEGAIARSGAVQLSRQLDVRVGHGFDVHPLMLGRGLMLGGCAIPCDLAVQADSDGDVLLHALADAMLGAAGLDDIGQIYPPGSPQGKDVPGDDIIATVSGRLREAGYQLLQADTTVICEAPRVAPHRDRMREHMADILGVAADCINLKATTTDGLGLTGRGEGIAAFAVVLLGRT